MIKNIKALQTYGKFVQKHPLVGISITSGLGMGVGNLLCQTIMYPKNKKIDLVKVAQFSMYGLLINGPILRYWWYALELKIFNNPNAVLRPVKMMLLDQATTPFALNGTFLLYLNLMDGKSWRESFENVKKKLIPVVVESYKVWPAAMLINFYVIPLHYRKNIVHHTNAYHPHSAPWGSAIVRRTQFIQRHLT